MGSRLLQLAVRLTDWAYTGKRPAEEYISELDALPVGAWKPWFAVHQDAFTWHVHKGLLQIAAECLDDNPARSIEAADFVLAHVDEVEIPEELDDWMPLRALLRGDAWIERGNALRQQCQLALSQEAFERAIAIYQRHPLAELDLERARRGRALVLHDTGRSAEALEIIEAGIAVFRRDRDLPDLARSYLYRGAVQFEIDAYSDAQSSFIDALSLARELGDRRTEARLLLNLGHCADALGDPQAAIAFLMDAFRHFVDLDMRSDQARVKWALAGLLAGAGELDHAIQHIEHAARTLTHHGLPGDAALATLDLLRMLHQTGRTEGLTWTATQLVTFFTGHGLLPHALEALRLLQEAAREGTLEEEDFDEARRRVEGE